MVKLCKVQTASTLTSVYSDWGGEYMGLALQSFFHTHGVTYQTSAPHTPQQNGCAERFNHTLLEKANVMRHHACMPHIFWQDVVQTALHIYNHQPICRLHWKTPNEMFLGDKPDISYFKVFGTCAYVHIPADTREDKLSPRAEQMIFIGYPPNSKAYHFWSQDHWQVYESTTAVFDERIFLYCSKENQDGPWLIPEDIEPHINPSYDESHSTRKPEPSGHVFIPQPLLPLPQLQVLPQQPNQQIPPGPADRRDQAHFLHPPPIHHHMNNLHMILGFIPMIQKNPMVGTLLGILCWPDMNHIHNEIHHLYPFSGIIHLLHTLENNQLTNLLHIEWSYHLLIWLLEETSQIPIINLAFGIDINTSNSWLAIIQNIYYWKEMK